MMISSMFSAAAGAVIASAIWSFREHRLRSQINGLKDFWRMRSSSVLTHGAASQVDSALPRSIGYGDATNDCINDLSEVL